MSAASDTDVQSLRHLHALRNFIGNLVEQAEKSGGCECHKPPSLLLVGPPGAGKTYLVKQMSKVCEMPLFGVHTHQVNNAASIKKLFSQARNNYPSLVFLDDVDSIFANHDNEHSCGPPVQQIREEIFSQLGPRKLKIHDPESTHNPTQQQVHSSPGGSSSSRGSSRSSSLSRPRPSAPELNDSYDESLYPDNNGIIVVAATSSPWLLYKDHELLSRFRGVYLVGLPDKGARYTLLQTLLREVHHCLSDDDIMEVAQKTQGFTPADLMVVMKTLSYRQFSFLLSMVNGREADGGERSGSGSDGNSRSTTPSSELTETGSDTDIDGLNAYRDQQKREAAVAALTAAALGTVTAAAYARTSPAVPEGSQPLKTPAPQQEVSGAAVAAGGEGLLGRVVGAAGVATVAAVATLQSDWATDSEEDEAAILTQRERAPSEKTSASPDSGLVQSSEETLPGQPEDTTPKRPHAPQHKAQAPSDESHQNNVIAPYENLDDKESCSSDDSPLNSSRESADHTSVYILDHGISNDAQPSSLDSSKDRNENSNEDPVTNNRFIGQEEEAGIGEAPANDGNIISSAEASPGSRRSRSLSPSSPSLHTDRSTYDNVLPDGSLYDPEPFPCDIHTGDHTHDSEGVDATGCSETEEVIVHPEHKDVPFPTQAEQKQVVNENFALNGPCDMREESVELHYSEPPEPLRDDNLAVDSDSDNESPMLRPRRVGFADRPVAIGPMSENGAGGNSGNNNNNNSRSVYSGRPSGPSPHALDCGGEDLPPNISLDINAGGSDNILRQLLSRPPMSISNGGVSPLRRASPGCSPTPPASPAPSNCSSGAATLASSGSGRASPSPAMHHGLHGGPSDDRHPQPRPRQQPSHGLHPDSPKLNPSPHQHRPRRHSPSPGSEGLQDVHNSNALERFHPVCASGLESDASGDRKLARRDSQRDAPPKIISGLGAASVAACAAADVVVDSSRPALSVNDDDLAKLVDALEMHMDGKARATGGSTGTDSSDVGSTDEESCTDEDEVDGEDKATMRALDEIGAGTMNIVPITLADVLDVIKKGYRTVSDEEMKKYTDFMVWFANVAKSACPHNNGSRSEAPSMDEDDFGVESTLCATPSLLKRNQRRRPLRKLGKFLLKALMFILD
ncbi:uncharacterized protein LOC108676555 isoform X2 [Hyalella azteca]|uniref:Uncharacterized protein LOC108676555 isoform X2 n=1 Tax=Hyalella azteca TaxID=294128 RepID=A0A8B7P290_HYAAZ|nr:uncharacterized protein LOC108676555 isoform X2 [Hyalella azteca]